MIKTILFDADGVLINGEKSGKHFQEKYGIAPDTTKEFFRGPFVDCLLGYKDARHELPVYLKEWGWQKSTDEFLREWFEFENKLDATLIADVQVSRQQGIGCYIATNQEKHRAQFMLDKMGFAESFDGLFASAHLGSKKPDHSFFQKVLDKLGVVEKETVLFWDDDIENVNGARSFGLKAELYTSYEDFKQKMGGYGLQ